MFARRGLSTLLTKLPGRAGGYPPGPPTDPYVRNSRIRFLRQSYCCPSTVYWPSVVRVRELKVSPLSPASGRSAWRSPSLPWVAWASLPHFHRYYAPLRLPHCPSRGASLVARLPDTLPASRVRVIPTGLVARMEAPRPRQGFWSPGPPFRV